MRSAAALFSKPRTRAANRKRSAAHVTARLVAPIAAHHARRTDIAPRGDARRVSLDTACRAPLARVRPLRLVPRGVIPYVKH
jgi:hypothetical protein